MENKNYEIEDNFKYIVKKENILESTSFNQWWG